MVAADAHVAEGRDPFARFIWRVLVVAAVAALLFLAWKVRNAFLLVLAAVVVAVLLDAGARPLTRRTGLSRTWALTVVGVVLAVLLGLFGWLAGSHVQSQFSTLISQLPQGLQAIEQRLGLPVLGTDPAQDGSLQGHLRQLLQWLASVGMTVAAALSSLILVVIGGFFLAASPDLYRQGLVKLFPKNRHQIAHATLGDCGTGLRLWLLAELIAMAIVGVLAGLGTWLVGLEAPLVLGLIAGLTEFIPVLGPIIGAIPALVLAVTHGPMTFVWALLLFVAIQQLESNVITPMLQQKMVTIPPALLIFTIVAFGLLFGTLGVIVAAPLTVILYIAVKKLYVREALGEQTPLPDD